MAEETSDETSEEIPDGKEKTGIKKLLANKIIVISAVTVLVLILAAGSYFLFFAGESEEATDNASEEPELTEGASAESEEKIELDIIPPEDNIDVNQPEVEASEKSKLEQISDQVKADAATLLGDNSNQAETSTTNTEQSKLEQELNALKQQNQQLKKYIRDIDDEVPAHDLTVPIDQLDNGSHADSSTPPLDNPYVNLEPYDTNNYFSSPYADDEQTPEPTWGD
jgi:flagellar basal body-associated protein FliL